MGMKIRSFCYISMYFTLEKWIQLEVFIYWEVGDCNLIANKTVGKLKFLEMSPVIMVIEIVLLKINFVESNSAKEVCKQIFNYTHIER